MRLVMRKIVLLLLVCILSIENVFAEDVICEYPDENLTLTYTDGKGMPKVEYKDWSNDDWTVNILLVKLGQRKYSGDEMEIAEELYQAQGATCPTKMYICEYTSLSLGAPNFKDVGEWLLGVASALGSIFIDGLSDFSTDMFEAADGIFIDQAKLFIMNRDGYNNNEYFEYEGGKYGWSVIDNYGDRYDDASWMAPGFREVLGGIWSLSTGTLQNLWENTLGDNPSKLYYRNLSCKKANYNGPNKTIDVNCSVVVNGLYRYDSAVSDYKNCTDKNCKAEKLKALSTEETKLKALCRNVLTNYTYNELQRECIESCLDLANTLNDKKTRDRFI